MRAGQCRKLRLKEHLICPPYLIPALLPQRVAGQIQSILSHDDKGG
jgi:hypothetical protein